MLLFTPMQLARHKHALVSLGGFIYALGGITADHSYSQSVERFNFITRAWEHVAPLTYPRQFPKACVSTNSNRIFIFGGCQSNDHNSIVEVYDCQDNRWYMLGIRTDGEQALVLKEPFNSGKSWALMIEGRWSALVQPLDVGDRPLFNDLDDKILIVTYDSLRFPAPSLFVINIEKESLGEVVYDKEGSDFFSNAKRHLVYDEIGEHVVAFA